MQTWLTQRLITTTTTLQGANLASYKGTNYNDLSAWGSATGGDANSLGVNPFYTSPIDLSFNHTKLWQAATPITSINYDIDSVARDSSTPDIGARNYQPCDNDAGIDAVFGVSNPVVAGTHTVQAKLTNQGKLNLTSVQVSWSVNDIVQTAVSWTGSLTTKASASINLGDYDFAAGGIYHINAWTDQPNGVEECNHLNDTTSLNDLATPLNGIYTIGGVDPDFIDFTEAVTVLNAAGVTGPVTFRVRDGYYDEQIVISPFSGMGKDNPIQFEGESGDSTKVWLRYNTNNSINDFTLNLDKSNFVSFSHIGFTRDNNDYLILLNGNTNISFEGCFFDKKRIYTVGSDSVHLLTFNNCLFRENRISLDYVKSVSINNSNFIDLGFRTDILADTINFIEVSR